MCHDFFAMENQKGMVTFLLSKTVLGIAGKPTEMVLFNSCLRPKITLSLGSTNAMDPTVVVQHMALGTLGY